MAKEQDRMMDASEDFKNSVSRLIARLKLYRANEEELTSVLAELLVVKQRGQALFNSTKDD
jgi:hypothetical protein